jgi:hypothetical protein
LDYEKVEKNMKLKLTLISILLGCVSSVHATIINLTPGGFNWNNPPQVVTDWYTNVRPSVWLWYPAEDFFTVTGFGTPTLTLSWNFAHPATFQWLFINSNDGPSNFYEIRGGQQSHFGEGTFTIDGITPIDATGELIPLVPFGHPPFETPDAGTTLMLFLIGIVGLMSYGTHKIRS